MKHVNFQTIKLYLRQIKKHRVTFLLALIGMPVASLLFDTFLPYFLSITIGEIASHDTGRIAHNLTLAGIVGLAGIVINIVGFQALLRHESRVRTDLYNATFKDLLNKDFGFFVNEKVGALTSRFIEFTRAHITLQDLLIIRTLGFVISVSVSLYIVGSHTPLLALILAGLMIIIMVQIRISTIIRKPYRKIRKETISEIHGEIADALTNNLIVKTFAGEAVEEKVLNKHLLTLDKAYIQDIGRFGFDGTIRNIIMTLTQIVGIGLCAYFVVQGKMELSIAIFALTYLQRIATQIFSLGDIINGYEQALLDASPMTEMLMKPIAVTDAPHAKVLKNITPTIELKGVTYRYNDSDEAVLQDLNITIPAGQKVGLVGHSGAGKTTITNLLLRFDDVSQGSILIDGHDIRKVTQESLRQAIAYVPQEPLLFHRSLRENIAYGKKNATTAQIMAAAKEANALEFIKKLPHGIDTLVGERGVKLSGGQRQRIAIARALLKDAPILVLDEATSALDSESEKLIQDALQELMKGRTSLVIAHRLSTIAKLDRIIVLENGRVVEDGSHSALLKQKGTYARLWARQSGGFIEE